MGSNMEITDDFGACLREVQDELFHEVLDEFRISTTSDVITQTINGFTTKILLGPENQESTADVARLSTNPELVLHNLINMVCFLHLLPYGGDCKSHPMCYLVFSRKFYLKWVELASTGNYRSTVEKLGS
ncbi:hypothetical protein ISN45_Aa07g030330 [Arabidopsis thaliana x Arabidopsis arenosa]|uniref:Uncharacterized protein n=1 Tax=Arabidopsis thaliana x Arabidopsis arenosa TaxID=1240361 RepID=A0A8T1Y7I4_9BRAS|nr:hypothetical protein ISN45_Aa07g030330 [Arabidopsis thaliana x Arabidopsis arenosa]